LLEFRTRHTVVDHSHGKLDVVLDVCLDVLAARLHLGYDLLGRPEPVHHSAHYGNGRIRGKIAGADAGIQRVQRVDALVGWRHGLGNVDVSLQLLLAFSGVDL